MIKSVKKLKNKLRVIPIEAKASFAYTLSNLLTKGIGIITIPVFTHILDPSEMGLVTLFMTWFAMLSILASFGVDSGSFNIAMLEYKEKRSQYISSALFFSTLSTILITIIYVIFNREISDFTGLPNNVLGLMFFGFLVTPAINMWLGRQRYEYNYKPVIIVSVISTVVASIL